MRQMFKLTDAGDQTEHSFHQHPLAPGFVLTKLEVARRFASFLEAEVTQDNRLLVKLVGEGTKRLVVNVGRVPVPGDDLAPVIDQPAQLNAYDPATVTFTFLASLLLTASFTHRMNQFNPIGVDDGEESRVGQKVFTPLLMRPQRTRDARAVGQGNEQRLEVAFQPAIKRPKETTFERVKQSYGHQFTRVELGIRTFWQLAQAIIYQTEQRDDKVFGGHGSYPLDGLVTFKNTLSVTFFN